MWTYEEALDCLNQSRRFGKKKGLEPLRRILAALGHPEEQMKIIHIAGTNGKGSTAATLAAILAASGLKVGLYTSPYIEHFEERLRIFEGREVLRWRQDPRLGEAEPERLLQALRKVQQVIEALQPSLSEEMGEAWEPVFFERLTASAFAYFAQEGCEALVLETGLGGRMDSTNVIPAPLVTVLTSLGYDHTEYLGERLDDIAREKAAILKSGTYLVAQDPAEPVGETLRAGEAEERRAAREVFLQKAQEVAVDALFLQKAQLHIEEENLEGLRFSQSQLGERSWWTPLLGDHQAMNVSLALAAAQFFLHQVFPDWTEDRLQTLLEEGLAATYWPARLECLRRDPAFLLDGAHNPQGAQVLAGSLAKLLPEKERPLYLICGFLQGKDVAALLEPILAWRKPKAILCVPAEEPVRALPAEEIRAAILQAQWSGLTGLPPEVELLALPSAEAALDYLGQKAPGATVVAFGSLFLAAPVKRAWRKLGLRSMI